MEYRKDKVSIVQHVDSIQDCVQISKKAKRKQYWKSFWEKWL